MDQRRTGKDTIQMFPGGQPANENSIPMTSTLLEINLAHSYLVHIPVPILDGYPLPGK